MMLNVDVTVAFIVASTIETWHGSIGTCPAASPVLYGDLVEDRVLYFRRCHAWCHAFLEISIDLACAQLSHIAARGWIFFCHCKWGVTQYAAMQGFASA